MRKTQLLIYFGPLCKSPTLGHNYLGEGDAEEQEKINDSAEQTWGVKHAGGGSAACYGRGEVNIFRKIKQIYFFNKPFFAQIHPCD